jgi:hypothetical protein
MRNNEARHFSDPQRAADAIVERVGRRIVLALPLGLGKANHVANALFDRAAADPGISLKILTALTLEPPVPGNELERRFLEPVLDRFFGGYPQLKYAQELRRGTLPENIEVHEFYFSPGRWMGTPRAQQNYLSINYTHALEFFLHSKFNVLAQLIPPLCGERPADRFSLSCNPDITVDLLNARGRREIDFLLIGQVNEALPYLKGEAERVATELDFILLGEAVDFPLFTLPPEPLTLADHAIGLQAAGLLPDGGTLQVGIGAIGDAVIHGLILRQKKNGLFGDLLESLGAQRSSALFCAEPFTRGLYGASEMLVDGFLNLIKEGILKREVDGVILHAGFFLGGPLFYRTLEEMPAELRDKIAMMSISFVNDIYSRTEAKREARTGARFINSAILATLLGAVVSDALDDGQVVSGVGGQYNFVAMAFALQGARSVITLPATRTRRGATSSNIRWSYGHTTIPRHLRDIVVTEYGVADLRGKTDAEVIAEMLGIADSRFQAELLEQAKSAGKIPSRFRIPQNRRENTPERLAELLGPAQKAGQLSAFPLGSDFSEVEEKLAAALKTLKTLAGSRRALARLAWRGWRRQPGDGSALACLERMGLVRPASLRERFYRALLLAVLD